jgi:hypothetical protein
MSARADDATVPTLAQEGWTRRFSAVGRRLDEMIELYTTLGYEVRVEAENTVQEAPHQACEQCVVLTLARTIYTRRPAESGVAVQWTRGKQVPT